MRIADRSILDEVGEQNFPKPDRVVLMGGAALQVLLGPERRLAGDIDLVTTNLNTDHLLETAPETWRVQTHTFKRARGTSFTIESVVDTAGRFDIWPHAYDLSLPAGRRHVSVERLKSDDDAWQDPATGIWLTGVNRLHNMKWHAGRIKDYEDVMLLGLYRLENHENGKS